MDEAELVKECLKGKREAQKQLYEQNAPKMLGVCYRYAGSMEEAEDFLQESFITIFRKLGQFRGEGNLQSWIYRIVINTSLNCLKSRYRLLERLDELPTEPLDDHSHDLFESGDGLMNFIAELPTGYRTVFNLHAIEGYSHEEIGQMLGIKPGTSRSQLTRAREILTKRLNHELNI